MRTTLGTALKGSKRGESRRSLGKETEVQPEEKTVIRPCNGGSHGTGCHWRPVSSPSGTTRGHRHTGHGLSPPTPVHPVLHPAFKVTPGLQRAVNQAVHTQRVRLTPERTEMNVSGNQQRKRFRCTQGKGGRCVDGL